MAGVLRVPAFAGDDGYVMSAVLLRVRTEGEPPDTLGFRPAPERRFGGLRNIEGDDGVCRGWSYFFVCGGTSWGPPTHLGSGLRRSICV